MLWSRSGLDPFDDGPEHDELGIRIRTVICEAWLSPSAMSRLSDVEGMFGIHLEAARRDVVVDGVLTSSSVFPLRIDTRALSRAAFVSTRQDW